MFGYQVNSSDTAGIINDLYNHPGGGGGASNQPGSKITSGQHTIKRGANNAHEASKRSSGGVGPSGSGQTH